MTESEEAIRENLRDLRESETRLSVVEKENLDLKDKVNILLRQNEHLERLNRILEKPEVISRYTNYEIPETLFLEFFCFFFRISQNV